MHYLQASGNKTKAMLLLIFTGDANKVNHKHFMFRYYQQTQPVIISLFIKTSLRTETVPYSHSGASMSKLGNRYLHDQTGILCLCVCFAVYVQQIE